MNASHLRVTLGFFKLGSLLAGTSVVRGHTASVSSTLKALCLQMDWILIRDGDASVMTFVLQLLCTALIGCLNDIAMDSFDGLVTHLPSGPCQVQSDIAPLAD